MADNTPRRRNRNVTGDGQEVGRRGEGRGTGPVGNQGGYSGRPGTGKSGRGAGGEDGGTRGSGGSILSGLLGSLFSGGGGGGKSLKTIIIVIVLALVIFLVLRLFGCTGNGLFSSLFGGGGGGGDDVPTGTALTSFTQASTTSGWTRTANTGTLNKNVASGARDKYTTIKGGNKDVVTIMIYMCGTDLESQYGMATKDIAEMRKATLSDNVNILIYTGGCKSWQTSSISNSTNQIYKVEDGTLKLLEKNMGNVSMTDPSTLSKFITWCKTNYPANRNMLIFWDHGGGSVSGYGHDERFSSSGSMSLAGINTALKNGGVKFDFVGFDACLMATAENAIMLTQYADYMIASEETEPGAGWYYTNWLTNLSKNTSMPTVEIGKNIVDDFTDFCATYIKNAKTTLSVVDLAELESTIPDGLTDFAKSTTALLNSDNYTQVSDARSGTREFSKNKIDQVDLVDLAGRMNTKEGEALAKTVLSAVKYNRTSSDMVNSYGLSIYFPYRSAGKVDAAIKTYNAIGVDSAYSSCIKQFAQVETSGQVVSGGSSASPLTSLLGTLGSVSSPSNGTSSGISSLLTSFLGGSSGIDIGGIAGTFLEGLDIGKTSSFISANHLDAKDFMFKKDDGKDVIYLSDAKWALVQEIGLNVFLDDGTGYIDLGVDNAYTVNQKGGLVGEYDGTWPAINGRPVAFYHVNTVDDGKNYTMTYRIPCLYNGQRADLIAVYDNANPNGVISCVSFDYAENVTETAAKQIDEIENGAKIDFLCDYYSYDGEFLDSYMFGDQFVVDGELKLSDVRVSGTTSAVYMFTDIYGQTFWSSVIGK